MEYRDSRLPKGVNIWLNNYAEYVATENNKVAQFENKNIRMDRTLEGAIQNYINKKVS